MSQHTQSKLVAGCKHGGTRAKEERKLPVVMFPTPPCQTLGAVVDLEQDG